MIMITPTKYALALTLCVALFATPVLSASDKGAQSGNALTSEQREKIRVVSAVLALKELHAELEDSFRCPITNKYMSDPVMTADGHTYERAAIERWFDTQDRRWKSTFIRGECTIYYMSPVTNKQLLHRNTLPNYALRTAIQKYIKCPRTVQDRPEAPVANRPNASVPARAGPGVEVRDAGTDEVNGWYVRKEAAQGPPRGWLPWKDWSQYYHPGDVPKGSTRMIARGRWYEKDDGCYIYQDEYNFHICTPTKHLYDCEVSGQHIDAAPPAQGWEAHRRDAPAPTLRVVD